MKGGGGEEGGGGGGGMEKDIERVYVRYTYVKLVIQDLCRHLVMTEEAAKAKLLTRKQCRTGKC